MRAASGLTVIEFGSYKFLLTGRRRGPAAALAILVIPLYHTKPEKILNAPAA